MKSGDAEASRGRTPARDRAQGSLEGILPPHEPKPVPPVNAAKGKSSRAPRSEPTANGSGALIASLDALEETITLLLDRHATLVAAHAAAEERRRSMDAVDPLALQDRVRALETDKRSLERHATFLEDRIRGLLSRVRYVNES